MRADINLLRLDRFTPLRAGSKATQMGLSDLALTFNASSDPRSLLGHRHPRAGLFQPQHGAWHYTRPRDVSNLAFEACESQLVANLLSSHSALTSESRNTAVDTGLHTARSTSCTPL